MNKPGREWYRLSRQLDVATEALDDIARYYYNPNRPQEDRLHIKAKAQKALDDIKKLNSQTTLTHGEVPIE